LHESYRGVLFYFIFLTYGKKSKEYCNCTYCLYMHLDTNGEKEANIPLSKAENSVKKAISAVQQAC